MTQPAPEFLDSKRTDAHAELFDKLSKLRTLLTMLHAAGFDMFRRLDVMRRHICGCVSSLGIRRIRRCWCPMGWRRSKAAS